MAAHEDAVANLFSFIAETRIAHGSFTIIIVGDESPRLATTILLDHLDHPREEDSSNNNKIRDWTQNLVQSVELQSWWWFIAPNYVETKHYSHTWWKCDSKTLDIICYNDSLHSSHKAFHQDF